MILAMAAATAVCGDIPIRRMISNYSRLVAAQDSPAIAHLFGTEGEIVNPGAPPIKGEAAVAKLLESFKGYKVTSERMTVAAVTRSGSDWRVTGHFSQHGRDPKGKPFFAHGSFDGNWKCTGSGWRIQRMQTGK